MSRPRATVVASLLPVSSPTISITCLETIAFPMELDDSTTGIVGYSRTTGDEHVTIQSIWSGRLAALSGHGARVQRKLRERGYEPKAGISGATVSIASVRLVDAGGASVAPMFIPYWATDVRMSGESLCNACGRNAIRLSANPAAVRIPAFLLDRLDASLEGRAAWTVTASSALTLCSADAARIARTDRPSLELELLIRATAGPKL